MLIDFSAIPETVIPHMRGGEQEVHAHMFTDAMGKVMQGRLSAGASIGLHTHETNCEVIYILSGTGKVLCDGAYEPLRPRRLPLLPQGTRSQPHQRQRRGFGFLRPWSPNNKPEKITKGATP